MSQQIQQNREMCRIFGKKCIPTTNLFRHRKIDGLIWNLIVHINNFVVLLMLFVKY